MSRILIVSILRFLLYKTTNAEDIDALSSGQLELANHCSSSKVSVESVYLTCDSPGAYYYASSSYRQSSRCKYGDKADLYIIFTIDETFDASSYGIDITIDAGVVNSFTNVQSQTNLCYPPTGSVSYLGDDDDVSCPYPGSYKLYTYFYIPATTGDNQLQYTPDIKIHFYRHETFQKMGCATTGTSATFYNASSKAQRGELALGIALAVFGVFFGACLCLAYRRKKQQEEIQKERKLAEQERRYYATTPPGETVIPLEHTGSSRRMPSLSNHGPSQQHPEYVDNAEAYARDQQYHYRHHRQQYDDGSSSSGTERSLGNPVWR